jgi:dCMP deaminase
LVLNEFRKNPGLEADELIRTVLRAFPNSKFKKSHYSWYKHQIRTGKYAHLFRRLLARGKGARPSWDEYFLDVTTEVAQRSTCLRRQVGAILVRDKRILTTGYNGAPRGLVHCLERGCLREDMSVPAGERHELCRGLHAEMNVIVQAAIHGVRVEGATLYCSATPCSLCVKMLINAGIVRIVALEDYPDELAKELLEEADIPVEIVKRAKAGK